MAVIATGKGIASISYHLLVLIQCIRSRVYSSSKFARTATPARASNDANPSSQFSLPAQLFESELCVHCVMGLDPKAFHKMKGY